jgi:hypothetical protein
MLELKNPKSPLPTGLNYTGEPPGESVFAEADPAHTELADVGAWTTAQLAAVVLAHRELRRPVGLCYH